MPLLTAMRTLVSAHAHTQTHSFVPNELRNAPGSNISLRQWAACSASIHLSNAFDGMFPEHRLGIIIVFSRANLRHWTGTVTAEVIRKAKFK